MPVTTQEVINALSHTGKWGGTQITFSVPGAAAGWQGYAAGEEPSDAQYAGLNTSQAAAFRLAIAAWDELIAPTLVEVSDATPGALRAAFTNVQNHEVSSADTAAYAYIPGTGAFQSAKAGDVWLDESLKGADFTAGGSAYETLLHELGHALGLKHPFADGAVLPAAFDNTRYTVMSYDSFEDSIIWTLEELPNGSLDPSGARVFPSTPMLFDLIAIQDKYGIDTGTAAGDTTYSWSQATGIMETIYDAGGTDTFDLSAHSRGSVVDLTPGAFSSIARWTGAEQAAYWEAALDAAWARSWLQGVFNRTDAYTWSNNVATGQGTVIENVIGSAGADTVTGNTAANAIHGRLGNDSISGGAGQDYLRGDEGNDSLTGGAAFDDIHGNMGDDRAWGGEGDDWVVGGKDNDVLYGETGADIVYGNLGEDTCEGGADADIVRGGQGNDIVKGDAGDDWLAGDRGNDTITGGSGADIFHSHTDAGIDRVLDFSRAEGDRVNLLAGTTYSVAQVGADVVISMPAGGGQLILVGVQLTSLTGDWLFGA